MDLVDKYSEVVTLYANNMPIEYVIKSPSENIWNYEAPVRTECTVVCDKPKQKNLVANELVRHRIASFAQESTRYCNYSKEKFGGELSFIRPFYIDVTDADKKCESAEYTPGSTWLDSCESAEILYKDMIALGMRPEQARCVLPLCLKTEIVVTANYREWRNIFKLRTPVAAHPQMRELMCPLLKELQSKIPVVFDDIYTYWPKDDQTGKDSMVK